MKNVNIDSMIDGLIVTHPKGNIIAVNKAILKMSKRTKKEMMGKSVPEVFLKPEDIEKYTKFLSEGIKKRSAGPFEVTGIAKDGTEVPVTANLALLKGAQGEPYRILCVIKDISQTKKLISELEETRKTLEKRVKEKIAELKEVKDYTGNVMKSIMDSLIVVDPDGRIRTVNRATEELLGYKKGELIGKPVGMLFGEEFFEDSHLQKLIGKSSVRNYETTYLTKGGKTIPVSFSGSAVRNTEGKLVGVVCIARDMREIKHLQDELIQSAKMAAIGELASGIAHEVRNPLAIMATSAQYLNAKLAPHDPKREFTKVINKNIEAIDTIIKRMLDLARPTCLELQSININRLVDETCRLIRGKASEQRVKIIKQYSWGLPKITVDEKRLGEVFLNLMMNALQAMPEGGWLRISTDFHQEENLISIQFRDNGEGIPPDYQKQIFNPFFTSRKKGVGLGLSLSQRTINEHHGTIEVDSQVGKGTTFTIKLPVSP